jgi:rRNA-processing protein FCF1
MFIIFTRKRKINLFEVVRNEGNNSLRLYTNKEIAAELEKAINECGTNNVLCFEKKTFLTKTRMAQKG